MAWKPVYVTVDEAREYMRIGDGQDDDVIQLAIGAASRAVDRTCGRQFGRVDSAEERIYEIRYDRRRCRYYAWIDDVMTTDDLTVMIDGTAVTDYRLEPRNAAAEGMPWTMITLPRGGREVAVTARWGWLAIPDPIKQAVLLQANRLFARRSSPWGVAGSPAQGGSEVRLLERLDPDIRPTVAAYVRWWGAR